MRNETSSTKRILIAAVALVLAGGVGACADQPMGPEEGYEVQMDGAGETDKNCIIIEGQIYCNG